MLNYHAHSAVWQQRLQRLEMETECQMLLSGNRRSITEAGAHAIACVGRGFIVLGTWMVRCEKRPAEKHVHVLSCDLP
uniref:Uncharacterized protein n=1 Tax=Thermosporothrix sp. COM3 TaxID=2490863 RepID=A0A455SZZ2_9CHLR|nr:hypothetical protein KTC_54050 [Thermosporothrix sp. COM3]